jgi:hypothetical protein
MDAVVRYPEFGDTEADVEPEGDVYGGAAVLEGVADEVPCAPPDELADRLRQVPDAGRRVEAYPVRMVVAEPEVPTVLRAAPLVATRAAAATPLRGGLRPKAAGRARFPPSCRSPLSLRGSWTLLLFSPWTALLLRTMLPKILAGTGLWPSKTCLKVSLQELHAWPHLLL